MASNIRKKRLKASSATGLVSPNIQNSVGKTNIQNSDTGILSMPHELLLEISQYLGPPFDFVTPLDWSINQMYSDGILVYLINSERRRTLHSLSQCCRALRSFFLPLAWEYFDACCTKDDHQACIGWKPPGSPNLELKCEGLVENPNLAAYVRVVNAHLVKSYAGPALSALAQCLQCLPNVHTLHIGSVSGQIATAIKTAFSGYRFPQIRTVTFPTIAHHMLSSCPQVREITCIGYQERYSIRTIAKKCKHVEVLHTMDFSYGLSELLVESMPHLRQISIRMDCRNFRNDIFQCLAALPHLHTITLYERSEYRQNADYIPDSRLEVWFQPVLQAAADVLRKHEGDENGKKWVHFQFRAKREGQLWTKVVEIGS